MSGENDLESSYLLVTEAWARLRDLDPRNDLLKFADVDEHEGFVYNKDHLLEASHRFSKDGMKPMGERPVTYFNAQYSIALRDAANRIETARVI